MKKAIAGIFAGLGNRLSSLGGDEQTREVIRRAAEQNPWFMPRDMVRAAANIAEGMLSRGAIEEWLAAYPALPTAEPRSVLVIMAGNVPFVGLQDLLCVLASGHRALVKMSSRDSAAMSFAVGELLAAEPSLPLSEYRGQPVDAVIAMGGDDTVRDIRNRYPGIPALLRGNRSSVGVMSGAETPQQAAALAEDILAHSGLGCRNVSLVFVPEGAGTALSMLAEALRSQSVNVNPKYLNNLRQTKALLAMSGGEFIDCGCCVLCEERAFPAAISRINYTRYASPDEAAGWIAAHENEIQCASGNVRFGRSVRPGSAHKPSLRDYPDGRDTMEFLSSL